MKAYNTLSTAYQLSVAEHGEPTNWSDAAEEEQFVDIFNEYFGKYLNISKYCGYTSDQCDIVNGEVIHTLGGDGEYSSFDHQIWQNSVLLQDGTLIQGEMGNNHGLLIVDTDGAKNGPNTLGRDVFEFSIVKMSSGRYNLVPRGYDEILTAHRTAKDAADYGCTPQDNIRNVGTTCGLKLLLEGKMNY